MGAACRAGVRAESATSGDKTEPSRRGPPSGEAAAVLVADGAGRESEDGAVGLGVGGEADHVKTDSVM